MKPDLKSMARKELEKLKADVEKALEKIAGREKKMAIAAAEKAAAAHGFSLAEITSSEPSVAKTRKVKSGPKTASPPKYRNPSNPEQTWTGKGRQPEWFKTAITSGTTPDAMEI
ncbi:H-NS histone family protein [Yoonia sp.]|uniref:H-NS histone family protein n=1 Tax=Yoonia sp. TaxID=2212373 RepID=UPI0025D6745E|nr:H-NS histone family protein [Yoonia sp.]